MVNLFLSHEARIKKTSVSGPAGGRNCGQSGGGNFFFYLFSFGLVRKLSFFEEKKFGGKNGKEKFPVLTHLAAGPETEVYLVWPKNVEKKDTNWVKTGIVEVALYSLLLLHHVK